MNARRDFLGKAALASVASVAAMAAFASVDRLARADSVVVQGVRRAARRPYPDVILRDQNNRPLRLYQEIIRDRVVVINMAYAECAGLCPLVSQNLRRVHKAMGDRVGRTFSMYTMTLNPRQDTPERLRSLMARERIPDHGWQFLTGDENDIELVRRRLGFVDVDPVVDADRRQHTGLVAIGNDRYGWWCMTPALQKPELLVVAIERMLKYM